MRWNSIRTKILLTLAVFLAGGVASTLGLLNFGFSRNTRAIATESVEGAQKLFQILEARETSKMTAVSETLLINPQVRDAFAAKDREKLLDVTGPLYTRLKAEGITNWMFHSAEPDMSVFLRLHNPKKFGDQLNRFMDKEVVRTHKLVAGNELGKAGFAVRILRPVYDAKGVLSGYVEFGEEIGRFIREMKSQTGDDYGLLLNKKFLDRKYWADSSALLKRRDNWDDSPSIVLADATSDSRRLIEFNGDLAAVDSKGTVLERFNDGDSVFVRGLFPIKDAGNNTVGAVFVVRDVSALYQSLRSTQTLLIGASILALVVAAMVILALLNRLVFRRLQHIIEVATRVVGGDFHTEIQVSSDDEIGQFETLFEQFRRVFVDVLTTVEEAQTVKK